MWERATRRWYPASICQSSARPRALLQRKPQSHEHKQAKHPIIGLKYTPQNQARRVLDAAASGAKSVAQTASLSHTCRLSPKGGPLYTSQLMLDLQPLVPPLQLLLRRDGLARLQ